MRLFSRLLLSLVFIAAGVMHFRASQTYLKIMPAYLPFPLALVYLSGAAEIAGGIGILPRKSRKLAGIGLIALLVAVFPANISMAQNGTRGVGIDIPDWIWWLRLPFQAVFIVWVWNVTQKPEIS
ncbi:MAG TPA: DoxX family protein [Abditibacterium sp.]|jgi:uncharacterized membrane protein